MTIDEIIALLKAQRDKAKANMDGKDSEIQKGYATFLHAKLNAIIAEIDTPETAGNSAILNKHISNKKHTDELLAQLRKNPNNTI
jgi:hypothetical protein